jgi:hypothetical protein
MRPILRRGSTQRTEKPRPIRGLVGSMMSRMVTNARCFFRGVIVGGGAPVGAFSANRYSYPHASELEAMRGDWCKVGGDMKVALEKAAVAQRKKDGTVGLAVTTAKKVTPNKNVKAAA